MAFTPPVKKEAPTANSSQLSYWLPGLSSIIGTISNIPFPWSNSGASKPLSEKKVTEDPPSPPSINMAWKTNFSTPGADSGSASFIAQSSNMKRNDVGIISVQNNYLFKPLKTWQVSILGDIDTYLGAEDYRAYFNGDVYFSALSSGSQGLLRCAEDASKDPRYYSLSNGGYDSWELSSQNCTAAFQTLLHFDGSVNTFTLWDLNANEPKKIFEQGGYRVLSDNVGPFKILGITDQTKRLEAWDLVTKKPLWLLENCFDPSDAIPRIGPFLKDKNWQLISYGSKFYCFDLIAGKLVWKSEVSKDYIGDLKVIDNKYVLVKCENDNHIILFSLADGKYQRQFEIGSTSSGKMPYAIVGLQMAALDSKNNKKPILYDLDKGTVIVQFQEALSEINSLTFSGKLLTGFHSKNLDSTQDQDAIATWDVATGSLISNFPLDKGQNYQLLDASDQFLVFISLDAKLHHPSVAYSTILNRFSRKNMKMAKVSQVKTVSRSIPIIPPLSAINLLVWDIQQKAFAGLITEKLNDVSGDAPMLLSFNNGTLTCSWLSQSVGEQILIKEYALKPTIL